MESPHHEDDAQYWHVVTANEFDREEYDPESTTPLRLAIVTDTWQLRNEALPTMKP